MVASYTSNLGFTKPANGDNNNSWDVPVNSNSDLLDFALSGVTAVGTTGGTTTLSATQGASNQARAAVISITGTLVSNAIVNAPATATKTYWVKNGTTGDYTVTFGVTSGTSVLIPQGTWALVYCDGTNANRVAKSPGEFWGGTAGGTATALTASTGYGLNVMPPAGTIVAVLTGSSDNTGATTIAVDSISATAVQRDGSALVAGDLPKSKIVTLMSDGTYWQIVNRQPPIPAVGAGGTSDAITATISGVVEADLLTIYVRSTATNTTTTPTLALNGGTARTITMKGGQALAAGSIGSAGFVMLLQYRSGSSNYELLNPISSSGGSGLTFNTITTGQTAASNNGYACNFSTSQVLTLPTSPTVGDVIQVDSVGAGIAQVQCGNASHSMYNWTTTITATGLLLLSQYETATLRYIATNKWIVEANVGTLTTAGTLVDPFFNDVTCLIPGNNNVTNYSGNALSFSAANLTFSTAQAKFNAYSMLFNGTSSVVSIAANTAFKFLGSCTLEGWFYQSNRTNQQTLFDTRANGTSTTGLMLYTTSTNGYLTLWLNNGALISTSTPMPSGQWNHIAVTNNALAGTSGTWSIWLNGAFVLSGSSALALTDGLMYLGSTVAASNWYAGYAAHIRVTNGVCRYSSNFTVPQTTFSQQTDTTADPVWTSTIFQSGFESNLTTTIDQSGNNLQFTNTGSVVQSTGQVKTGTYSAQFSGSNYLSNNTFAPARVTGDITIEGWFYATANGAAGNSYLLTVGGSAGGATGCLSLNLVAGGSTPAINCAGSVTNSAGGAMGLNGWVHLAIVRSGGVATLYVGGAWQASAAFSSALSGTGIAIGGLYGAASAYLTGYVDQACVHLFAKYTSNFTPSANLYTALPTAYDPFWQDTILLLRGAGSNAVTDVSGNALTLTKTGITTGTSTPTPQQDSYWIDFSGSSSITAPTASASYPIGDFQFETWVYISGYPGSQYGLIDTGSDAGFRVKITSTGTVTLENNGGVVVTSATVGLSGWHHVAAGRQGTTYYVAIDGVQATPAISATAVKIGTVCYIGEFYDTNWKLNGKLAGTRLSLTCRYTANFTAPTSPFLTVGAT